MDAAERNVDRYERHASYRDANRGGVAGLINPLSNASYEFFQRERPARSSLRRRLTRCVSHSRDPAVGASKFRRGRCDDSVGCNAKMAIQIGCRARDAEATHANEGAVLAKPSLPAHPDGGLDADTHGSGAEDLLAIG